MTAADWDRIYQEAEVGRYPSEHVVRFMAQHFYRLPSRKDVRILEVGCGSGPNVWYLAREGFSATGIDFSREGITAASSRLAQDGLSADLRVADATKLPFEDACFDAVIDFECLSALRQAEAERAIAEAHRVLRPGGIFFSVAFAVGITLEGDRIEGEPHTYLVRDCPFFLRRFGVHRLTAAEEIPALFRAFADVGFEEVTRTKRNRDALCRQWLITAQKSPASEAGRRAD